jgi:hypothetical protein
VFLIYRIIRLIRRSLRRYFEGDPPSWAADIYKAVKFINFIELIPTIAAIALVPRHFFRRVNLILQPGVSGVRKSIYKTPIQFVAHIITLLLASKFLSQYVAPTSFKVILGLILISLPILIPLFCILLCILLGFVVLLTILLSLPTEFVGALFSYLSYVLVPLTPSTYSHLNWRKAAWCALYFYGYLIIGPIFLLSAIGVLLAYGSAHLPQQPDSSFAQLALYIVWAGYSVIVVVLARVVVFPYSSALVASLKRPTKGVIRSDLKVLFTAIEDFRDYCLALQKKEMSKSERHRLLSSYPRLQTAWAKFPGWWSRYVIEYSLPKQSREDEKARVIAMAKISSLAEQARYAGLKKEAVVLIASIYVESRPLAERENAKSAIADWFPSFAPFIWEERPTSDS